MAKVEGFKEQPKERASSPVPQVVLVDTSRPEVHFLPFNFIQNIFNYKKSPRIS